MYAVGVLTRHLNDPPVRRVKLLVFSRITRHNMLYYLCYSGRKLELHVHKNSDLASDRGSCILTSRYVVLMARGPINWISKCSLM